MPTSDTLPRRRGESFACGARRPAGSRRRAIGLAGALALVAAAAVAGLAADGARAQTTNQEIPPALQQPLPVQPGQPQPSPQPSPQQAPQAQPSTPASPAASGQPHGDWIQRCTPNPPPGSSPPAAGKQEVCFLIQEVMEENSRRPLLKITVGFFGAERQLRAIIAMPLGVPLATGIQISVDGQAIGTVPFDICRRDGCLADLLLNDTAVNAFKAGSKAQARVASSQGEGINLPISLRGFTAGYTAIQ